MAVDKLVDSTQLDSDLTSVANAIRTKGGTSAQLAFPAGFVQAIGDIPTGGGASSLIYSLPEPLVCDGSGSGTIDTGIHLFRDYANFTILMEAEVDSGIAIPACAMHCMNEIAPFPGCAFDLHQLKGLRTVCDGDVYTARANGIVRFALSYETADGITIRKAIFKPTDANVTYSELTRASGFAQVAESVLLGQYQSSTGEKGRYWKGKISSCRIYATAMSAEEITGFVQSGVAPDQAVALLNILLGVSE